MPFEIGTKQTAKHVIQEFEFLLKFLE